LNIQSVDYSSELISSMGGWSPTDRGGGVDGYRPPVMQAEEDDTTTDQDWRLTAELDLPGDSAGALNAVITRFRGPGLIRQIEPLLGHDVVITHDGKLLFVYAAEHATLISA
jgi:hypothetical protein